MVLLSVSCLCVLGEGSLLRWVDLSRDLDLLEDLFSRVKGDLWLFLEGRSRGGCWACWTKSGGVGGLALIGTSTRWLPCWSPDWNGVGALVVDASQTGARVSWTCHYIQDSQIWAHWFPKLTNPRQLLRTLTGFTGSSWGGTRPIRGFQLSGKVTLTIWPNTNLGKWIFKPQ